MFFFPEIHFVTKDYPKSKVAFPKAEVLVKPLYLYNNI
jgi:hypothetical protein